MAGDFSFSIGDVMREAWELTHGSKGVIVGGFAIFFGLGMASGIAASVFERTPGAGTGAIGTIIEIGTNLIANGIFAGMYMYTVKRAAHDRSAAFADLFAYFPKLLLLIGLYILQGLLTVLGLLLLVLPGLYLAVAYLLATPLLLDKGLGPWAALEASRKAITHVWFQFAGLTIVVTLASMLGTVLTAGIGGIWLVPWSMLCLGVAYRKTFGYGPAPV